MLSRKTDFPQGRPQCMAIVSHLQQDVTLKSGAWGGVHREAQSQDTRQKTRTPFFFLHFTLLHHHIIPTYSPPTNALWNDPERHSFHQDLWMGSLAKSSVKLIQPLLCRPGMTVRIVAIKTDSLNSLGTVGSWDVRGQTAGLHYQKWGGCAYCNKQKRESRNQRVWPTETFGIV